jgi:hypothetical protein
MTSSKRFSIVGIVWLTSANLGPEALGKGPKSTRVALKHCTMMGCLVVDQLCKALRDCANGDTVSRLGSILVRTHGRFLRNWNVFSLQSLKGDQSR